MMHFLNLKCESSLATALVYQSTSIYVCYRKLINLIQALTASLDKDPPYRVLAISFSTNQPNLWHQQRTCHYKTAQVPDTFELHGYSVLLTVTCPALHGMLVLIACCLTC